MATLDLHFFPAPVLRKLAEPVTVFNDDLRAFLEDMAETMYVESGIGLAAPQVGVSKRIFVMDVASYDDDGTASSRLTTLVNPEIVEKDGTIVYEEGCLSFPGITADVTRALRITVNYVDGHGVEKCLSTEGLESVCVQHELDHLNGVTFVDYLSPLKRKLLLRELKRNLMDRGVSSPAA